MERPTPEVNVVWRELPATPAEREEHARQIAAVVLTQLQRPASAPTVLQAGLVTNEAAGLKPVQAESPLSYVEGGKRIVSVHLSDVDDGIVRAVTEDGEVLELKKPVRKSGPGTVDGMTEPLRLRRPMIVNRRPGTGGLNRASDIDAVDVLEGINEYGEVVWRGVKGGASVGTLHLSETGNGVIICRLSSAEKNDRLVDQLRPCLALAKHNDIEPRLVIFAVNMSGKREVRPDRAGPPADGIERDDMLDLDKYIAAGWVEHILARGGDRIARDILPGETVLSRWAKNGIGLWLSDLGRRMNYATDSGDRMLIRTMMMISAEERNAVVLRLERARLNKGPLAGNGHLGPTRFGILRNKKTRQLHEDPEQWPWILRAFELADSGLYLDGEGLSTRKVAAELAAEGCPFDHDRVRRILKDKIYATGEYTTRVHGIAIAQTPVQLKNPVPLDRYMRVQNLVALRKGRSSRTPLGEFLLNYVKAVHLQCAQEFSETKRGSIVKGIILAKQTKGRRVYRHALWVPECCKGKGRGRQGAFSWERQLLERPIVEAVRELATHPELLRQLQLAARHTLADSSARLTDAQIAAIENEIIALQQRQEEAIEAWIDRTSGGTHDLAGYDALISKFIEKIETLKRRVETDAFARKAQLDGDRSITDDRVSAFLEILTVETPRAPFMRQLRARLFQQIISRVVIDDDGEGPITVTLEGHLVPEGAPLEAGNPILAAEELLDSYLAWKNGKKTEAETLVADVVQIETDLSDRADKSVSISSITTGHVINLPTTDAVFQAQRRRLDATQWHYRIVHGRRTGEPAWVTTIEDMIPTVHPVRRKSPRAAIDRAP